MPASNVDMYLQDARNNFDAVRPAPICTDANQSMGQCQNVHISTNCYYGYHDLKGSGNHVDTDCDMVELDLPSERTPSQTTSRKRSADDEDCPQRKRLREVSLVNPDKRDKRKREVIQYHADPKARRCWNRKW